MFKRDKNVDVVRKAQAKMIDAKRDSFNRLKHLKTIVDHVEANEAKEFFQSHHSTIFFVVHDAFSIIEANTRLKGVQKTQKDELEQVCFILEKVLTLLPELVARGWQAHSLRIIFKKLLHPGNAYKIICEGIRLFIIWYQILRDSAPLEVDAMFTSLIPNVACFNSPRGHVLKDTTFYISSDAEGGEICCLFPPAPSEIQPEDLSSSLLDYFLQVMVTQTTKIQWAELIVNGVRQYECSFGFLLDKFRDVYTPYIFPKMSQKYSLYDPNMDLPAAIRSDSVRLTKQQSLVILFFIQYVQPQKDEREAGATRSFQRIDLGLTFQASRLAWTNYADDEAFRMFSVSPETDLSAIIHRAVVRNVLYSTTSNVDFVHEIFRQCFVSPLGQMQTTKKVIAVYRDWIQMNMPDPPTFLIEQPTSEQLRNPVYCGSQNLYKVFITNASNFFLLCLPASENQLLEEQVDLCKRVINIYRFMVMKKLMERPTWEQLLYVILHVTSQVLANDQCTSKESLGFQLAPALFQTLIVTWIKANLHATICVDLWNGFLRVLSSLAHWEPLVDEWAKTMKTLTRILTNRVYNLDLDKLPLDRLSEQQFKRRYPSKGDTGRAMENSSQRQTQEQTSGNTFDEKREKRNSISYTSLSKRRYSDSHLYINRSQGPRGSFLNTRTRSCVSFNSYEFQSHESATTSPAVSTNALENNSIKDHPLTHMMDCASNENDSVDSDGRSVLAGGSQKGWCPEVSVVLWRRMVCSLGNVNDISDPIIQARVLGQLAELCETLLKIRDNQGIVDGKTSSVASAVPFMPPIHLLTPWFFEATMIMEGFDEGRMIAYKLLCDLTFRNFDIPLTAEYVTRLFDVLHKGLTGKNQRVRNCVIKASGTRFVGSMLPGFSLLLRDYIYAAIDILEQHTLKAMPRTEAVMTLGAHIFLPSIYQCLRSLDPSISDEHRLLPLDDLQRTILSQLILVAKSDPDWQARCTALSAISIFCFQQVANKACDKQFLQGLRTIVECLKPTPQKINSKGVKFSKCNQYTVCRAASDCLTLLAQESENLSEQFPNVLELVCSCISNVLNDIYPPRSAYQDLSEDFSKLIISLMFCLADWTMKVMPVGRVNSSLHTTLMTINAIIKGERCTEHSQLNNLLNSIYSDEGTQQDVVDSVSKNANPPLTTSFSDSKRHEGNLTSDEKTSSSIKIAAKAVLCHLINNIGHFPMNSVGLTNFSTLTIENDDVPELSELNELSRHTFSAPNIQFFTLNNSTIVSFVEIPPNDEPCEFTIGKAQTRVIVRDISGKFSWDCFTIYGPLGCRAGSFPPGPASVVSESVVQANSKKIRNDNDGWLEEDKSKQSLNQVLSYLSSTSPECEVRVLPTFNDTDQQNNSDEVDQINEILDVTENEIQQIAASKWQSNQKPQVIMPPQDNDCSSPTFGSQQKYCNGFQYSRLLLDQLNYLGWENRSSISLLQKNDKLLRELRYLDQQRPRETHKIAVIYVGAGQEDKNSILMNQSGSPEFENFVEGLGWNVDLRTHTGYRGGLDQNGSTGLTAPYFANSFVEVLFHISTRIPAAEKEAMTKKLRHLGNDEVHVVWSEHQREYRRGIIATEFGDVFIVIYPLPDNLCRVQINAKPDVPFFGPLFDGAIVEQKILPSLVRATAINADRAVNSLKMMFRSYYDVRFGLIENLCGNFKENTSFEEFASKVFSPSAPKFNTSCSTKGKLDKNISLNEKVNNEQPHPQAMNTSVNAGGYSSTPQQVEH